MLCWARSGYSQRMKGKDCQKYSPESINTEHAQLVKEHDQLLKEHSQLLKDNAKLAKENAQLFMEQAQQAKKFHEEALVCSLVTEILTTEEFAKRIQSCRATVQAWKKAKILTNGRHFVAEGSYVTFSWPLSYVRMMEDKVLPGQTIPRAVADTKTAKRTVSRTPRRREANRGSKINLN